MYVKLVVRDSSHPAEPLRSFPKGQVMKRTSPFCHVRSHQPRTQILVFNHILSGALCKGFWRSPHTQQSRSSALDTVTRQLSPGFSEK